MFLEALKNWKIVKRVLLTLLIILVFRFGSMITIPGFEVNQQNSYDDGSFLGILNMLGGGGLYSFSLFAMGVTPYITASIIIQLLSSDVIPPLAKLSKKGEKGRIQLEKITRLLTIFLAVIQVMAISLSMISSGYVNSTSSYEIWKQLLLVVVIMTAGSMISIWFADQITMKGVGNGTSLIIFSGIVAQLPYKYISAWGIMVDESSYRYFIGLMNFLIYSLISLVSIFVLGFFETSVRKIPIQQTGQGLNLIEDKQTFLPVKINPAGVIPVIFASSLITLPPTIAQFLPDSSGKQWVVENFALTSIFGLFIYALLIIIFSYFYSQININPEEMAKNFQKSSTFIIGVKPGEETRKYLSGVITSITTFGSIILMLVATFPYILTFFGIPKSISVGGTGTIIIVSVAIDTWDQFKSRVISERTKKQAGNIKNINSKKDNFLKNTEDDSVLLFE